MSRENDNLFAQLHHGEPIQLRWNGWVSDTHILSRQGWKFTASQHKDEYSGRIAVNLAATDPTKYVVIAGNFMINPQEFLQGDWHRSYMQQWDGDPWGRRSIEMQQFTARDVFRTIGQQELQSWQGMELIDVTMATHAQPREIYMGSFNFFKKISGLEEAKQEIYIPQKSVDELLNEILKIQYPEQQKIKKGLILPEAKPIIQAKIFSLAV